MEANLFQCGILLLRRDGGVLLDLEVGVYDLLLGLTEGDVGTDQNILDVLPAVGNKVRPRS